jgi:hypothetical protein
MAITLFDLEISVASPVPFDGISREEKRNILRKPDMASTKPKEAGSLIRAEVAPVESPVDELTLEEIGEGYKELIARTNNFLGLLEERVGEHTRYIDQDLEPALATTVASLYQGVSDKITFSMYLSALRLEKNISVAIAEAQVGNLR